MGEIEKQFVTEFDYTLEAQLLRQATHATCVTDVTFDAQLLRPPAWLLYL